MHTGVDANGHRRSARIVPCGLAANAPSNMAPVPEGPRLTVIGAEAAAGDRDA